MSENSSASSPASAKNPWPRTVTILGLAALLGGAGLWIVRGVFDAPGDVMGGGVKVVEALGSEASKVARAFREGTVRQEFLSHATELTGTSRLQVATLQQRETFLREETGSLAWGLIPVPKIVVQAQAPVEYSYYLDLTAPWEFRQQDRSITVIAPPLQASTPAIDVSALTFYTIEGGIWNDAAVRDRLRETLTTSLRTRALNNFDLVRETSRRQVADFVEKWLAEKFGDVRDYRVKVLFADEQSPTLPEKPRL